MYDRLKNLLSPLFIVCLVLLIVNDFFLKAAFHNMFTGKLSDFCGLFIFPIFWSVVFPKQKLSVFILTGVMFVFWKSEYASGLIEVLNMFNIQRTIDPTDLIALPVLLLGWFHINNRPQVLPGNSVLARSASLFIGVVTIFSFFATSQQRYVQSFDQPQYVLLQSSVIPNANLYDEFDFYKVGSLLVVKVNQVYILKPIRDDDYNKNRSIKELDQDVLERIADGVSLIPKGRISTLSISTPQGTDSLRFNGGRLDGRFSRTKGGKRIIEGFYKMGLEDATWTINDSSSNNIIIHTFVNGERTSTKQFAQHKLISTSKINTRADTIRNKYIQIGILVLIVMGIIVLLVRNYRKIFPQQLNLKGGWKWLLCFMSPIFIWLLHAGIRTLLLDFNQDIFETVATIIFIFLATCPLMFVVVFWIRLRKEMDIFLYCLLFGVLCSIWTTCGTLIELHN